VLCLFLFVYSQLFVAIAAADTTARRGAEYAGNYSHICLFNL